MSPSTIPEEAPVRETARAPVRLRFTRNIGKSKRRVRGASTAALADYAALIVVFFVLYCAESPIHGFAFVDLKDATLAFLHNSFSFSVALYGCLLVIACFRYGLYGNVPTTSLLDEHLAVLKAVSTATAFLLATLYSLEIFIPGLSLASAAILACLVLIVTRSRRRAIFVADSTAGINVRHALIIGGGKVGQSLRTFLQQSPHLGFDVKGFLDNEDLGLEPLLLGRIEQFAEIVRGHFIDDVFVTIPSERALVKDLAFQAIRLRVNLNVVPDLFDGLGWVAPLSYLGDFPVMRLHRERDTRWQMMVKRCFDVVASAVGLIVLSPLMILIAALIKVESRGPVLYRAARVGRKGEPFTCLKFRTMVDNADAQLHQLQHLNERDNILFKISADPRVTKLGSFLRKYSFDELPQLLNVLLGEMSLVGPRPPAVNEVRRYENDQLRRLNVVPGITGLWQVTARRDPSFQSYIERDVEYIENWSLWMDIKVLFRTVAVVLEGTGQ
jgi:exopolysaccharide biosynthesis polyprenyl glycosylphosphotransferase